MGFEKIEKYFCKYGLQDEDRRSEAYFSGVVAIALNEYALEITDIAHEFGVSKPTVERWAKGVSAPMPQLRPFVLEWIVENI